MSLINYIPVKDVEEIVNHQFKFIRKVMESAVKNEEDTFKTVALPLFGKFAVPKGKVAILAKIAENRRLKKEETNK